MSKYNNKNIHEIKQNVSLLSSLSDLCLNLDNMDLYSKYYSAYYENNFQDVSFGISDVVFVSFLERLPRKKNY